MSMIGFSPQILGREQRPPLFHGTADITWDGKYLWVSSRDSYGEPPITTIAAGSNGVSLPQSVINVVSSSNFTTGGTIYVRTSAGIQAVNHTSTNFPTNNQFTGCTGGAGVMTTGNIVDQDQGLDKVVWVLDPSTGIPRTIAKIDLNSYPGRVVRGLNVSNNGLYVYVCLAGYDSTVGGNPAQQCSCLVIDKSTFQVVGNARVTSALIGGPSFYAGGRAVFAVDDGHDHLWVVNSNQSNGNAVERFSLTTVLANGTSPTSSAQVVNVVQPHHAEELVLGSDGYLYTGGSDESSGASRINPTTGAITHSATTGTLLWGPKFFLGALWGGDFNFNLVRCDPTQFGLAGFVTDKVAVPGCTTSLGGIACDGTYIWTAGGFNSTSTSLAAPSIGQSFPQSTITVSSTTNFPSSGSILVPVGVGGLTPVLYTNKTSTTFTGCTGGFGTMTSGTVQSRRVLISKFSATGGSVAVVTTVAAYVPTTSGQGIQNLVYDGSRYIYGVQRVLSGLSAIIRIDTTPGSEKVDLVWPTGGSQSQSY